MLSIQRWQPFQIVVRGRPYAGSWRVVDGRIQVSSTYGSASRPATPNQKNPKVQVEIMLRELVNAWQSSQ
jgi:hypothetical protein